MPTEANVDVSSKVSDILNGEIDDEDSFFDLVIKSDYNAINGVHEEASNPISPVTPLRSSPKLKIFILGFKKPSKSVKTESNAEFKASPLHGFSKSSKDSSVFIRDNSLRTHMLENSNFQASYDVVSSMKPVPKYLKLIKPFYNKASSKKAKVTPSCSPAASFSPGRLSEGSRKGSFKFIARKLVKSRSTSAAVGMSPLPEIRRRDDTLLEQHDGIQGAILHCKKSYSSSCQEKDLAFEFKKKKERCTINM